MKTYESAFITAIEAQHKSIDEIERLIRHRQIQAFLDGGSVRKWQDFFWHNMAIIETVRCNNVNM